jgi:hypothetical protein
VIPLVALPCGHVVDWQAESVVSECRQVFQCDWCDAAFDVVAMSEWFSSGSHAVWMQRTYLLLEHDAKLYELVGPCDNCRAPSVRERGNRDSKMHLNVTMARLAN